MSNDYAVGIDIGGTKIAIGIVDSEGEICSSDKIDMDKEATPDYMVENISANIKSLLRHKDVKVSDLRGIGIGAPGPLNTTRGMITSPQNLPGWWDYPIVERVQQHFHAETNIVLENDANAAAVAEKWKGAGTTNENFVYVTISTGIGGGLFSNSKLLQGVSGNAGEIGHIVIDPSLGTCPCGQKGCWEFIASGTAISRRGSELKGYKLPTKKVIELANQGDVQMKQIRDQSFEYIGMGCVTLINMLDPEKIIIGGGVSQIGDPLFLSVRDYVSKFALNPTGRTTEIVPAGLQQSSGLIGAASLIHGNY
ncbi:transcriptional regulator [Salipaludibacillus neizhouensis]|uniref:Transcriptional regulator n=1 Tax=Salipaludibacillus neizhouensis TaxID=885475 RepID=A0A3A9K8W3_9BACI|nr:ROK family protein [Salipaludibacillus neizhouensis]RKL66962.1 transcriptional regulator [Salipaludibacillus neizhouensis]